MIYVHDSPSSCKIQFGAKVQRLPAWSQSNTCIGSYSRYSRKGGQLGISQRPDDGHQQVVVGEKPHQRLGGICLACHQLPKDVDSRGGDGLEEKWVL